jgi:hypothetical protein
MMILTGISAKIKDRRVDRILRKVGYDITACEIYYSPVRVWLFGWVLLLVAAIPVSFYFFHLAYQFTCYFLLYFLLGYVVVGYLNNSFVIVPDKLLVINPNFPFNRVVSYNLKRVRKVKIDNSAWLWITAIFAHWGNNYVEISTENRVERFYCTCLEVDAFDENFTEKTMDDFQAGLLKVNVPTEFNLD